MKRRRLMWQIYPLFLFVIVIGLAALSWHVSVVLRDFYRAEKTDQLERLARVVGPQLQGLVGTDQYDKMQSICLELARATTFRFTLIDPEGKVLADSDEDPWHMENHLMRPEVQTALSGQFGSDIRFSRTVGQELLYVGVPLQRNGQTAGVLRIAVPLVELRKTTRSIILGIVRYGLLIAAVLAALSLGLSWKISRPLEVLRRGAERFAQGDLGHRLPVSSSNEIGVLAEAMNQMAAQLDQRLRSVITQRNEQQAMLSSMTEGVLAVDIHGRVMSVNRAAEQMLHQGPEESIGRNVEEVVRNTELQHFIARVLDSAGPIQDRLVLHDQPNADRHLQVNGAPLLDDAGKKIGVLVVLNDITRIHRLEQLRSDFVANVSHELKTPVTSIKGFIETLLDGAMEQPENRRRFLEIIARQAQRLDSIIDDLLILSRLEQQDQTGQMDCVSTKIRPILTAAAELCQVAAAEKNIRIEIECPEDLHACVNASLCEQAVVNLVDNAVKYSEDGQEVRIEAEQRGDELQIRVRDHGCGIAPEHLPRLFERFYRVDKARSRKLGGTGLGLAIVKHIAQFHKGHITVESQLNQGSVFTLHLPQCAHQGGGSESP